MPPTAPSLAAASVWAIGGFRVVELFHPEESLRCATALVRVAIQQGNLNAGLEGAAVAMLVLNRLVCDAEELTSEERITALFELIEHADEFVDESLRQVHGREAILGRVLNLAELKED